MSGYYLFNDVSILSSVLTELRPSEIGVISLDPSNGFPSLYRILNTQEVVLIGEYKENEDRSHLNTVCSLGGVAEEVSLLLCYKRTRLFIIVILFLEKQRSCQLSRHAH